MKSAVLYDVMESHSQRGRQYARSTRFRTVIWSLALAGAFTLSHLPPPPTPIPTPIHDKTLHVIGFFILGFLSCWRLARLSEVIPIRTALFWYWVLLVYGAIDELTQPLTGRTCELGDWFADAAGAALGMACFMLLDRWRLKGSADAVGRVD